MLSGENGEGPTAEHREGPKRSFSVKQVLHLGPNYTEFKHQYQVQASEESPSLPSTFARQPSIWRQWSLEISFCMISVMSIASETSPTSNISRLTVVTCHAVIIGLLAAFDGKANPKLPGNITLNALLALFTTLTKAAFMVPIAEAISQWKWNVYHDNLSKPLAEYCVLDLASRSAWGSWGLIYRSKLR